MSIFDATMKTLALLELQEQLAAAVDNAFPAPCWVRAEVNQLSERNGHCYMELVQKQERNRQLLAKAQATIWANVYGMLKPFFESATGMALGPGMQVLLCVEPRLHPLYGLSLQVQDIDPSFTLGGLELERRKTLERLEREGVIDMNAQLPFPRLPLRVAVVSSDKAAGYQDFLNQLHASPYAFRVTLFPAIMQGASAPESIRAALDAIAAKAFSAPADAQPDVVLILRGGGAETDLHCYDDYDLAAHIAQFPLPVLTGIGHHKDSHIADRVAALSVKTPTAAADFLVACLAREDDALQTLSRRLERVTRARFAQESLFLEGTLKDLRHAVRWLVGQHQGALDLLAEKVRQNDPMALLEKGYSLTMHQGKAVRNAAQLEVGARVDVWVHQGSFEATVTKINQK